MNTSIQELNLNEIDQVSGACGGYRRRRSYSRYSYSCAPKPSCQPQPPVCQPEPPCVPVDPVDPIDPSPID